MTIFWINLDGSLNCATDDRNEGPPNTKSINVPPKHGRQIWDGSNWNDPEKTWDDIRAERKPLLKVADIEILKQEDTGGDTLAWRSYRQTLRDITINFAAPTDVVWPSPPS